MRLGLRLQDHVKRSFSGTTGASETTYLRDLTEPSEIISEACKPFLVRVLASEPGALAPLARAGIAWPAL